MFNVLFSTLKFIDFSPLVVHLVLFGLCWIFSQILYEMNETGSSKDCSTTFVILYEDEKHKFLSFDAHILMMQPNDVFPFFQLNIFLFLSFYSIPHKHKKYDDFIHVEKSFCSCCGGTFASSSNYSRYNQHFIFIQNEF